MTKILLIEDEPDIVESFQFMFTEILKGYRFFSAGDGESGLKIVEDQKPDVVVLDLKLGAGIDGIEVLRRAKRLHEPMKTIVLTGYLDQRHETEAQALGVDAYLAKPLDDPLEIDRVIRKLVA